MKYELVIIGGGPAGLSAAYAAWEAGCRSICIVERDRELGGILNQCIHNGFGLHYFKEELTGPEYAGRFIDRVGQTGVDVRLDAMVLDITPDKHVHIVSSEGGYEDLEAKAVILAMGCRERTRGAIAIPGTRPAGVFTAGAAQRYLNIEGYMVGRRVVILGSGDIGLIMARRMTLEGAKVLACVEVMPYSGGLTRNIVQCLNDFDIPLYLSHTVSDIQGRDRVERVVVSEVGPDRRPIPGTEMTFDCDTVLLSVGLIPENELTKSAGVALDRVTNGAVVDQNRETGTDGIFACGNVLHVHDLVDFVSEEAAIAGESAAAYLRGDHEEKTDVELHTDGKIRYTVPQRITEQKDVTVFFRVSNIYRDVTIKVTDGDKVVFSKKKAKVAPGEMESITLTPAQFAGASELDFSLEVAES